MGAGSNKCRGSHGWSEAGALVSECGVLIGAVEIDREVHRRRLRESRNAVNDAAGLRSTAGVLHLCVCVCVCVCVTRRKLQRHGIASERTKHDSPERNRVYSDMAVSTRSCAPLAAWIH